MNKTPSLKLHVSCTDLWGHPLEGTLSTNNIFPMQRTFVFAGLASLLRSKLSFPIRCSSLRPLSRMLYAHDRQPGLRQPPIGIEAPPIFYRLTNIQLPVDKLLLPSSRTRRLCRNSPIVTPAKTGARCRVLSQKYSGCVINIVLIIKYLYFLVLRPVPVVK